MTQMVCRVSVQKEPFNTADETGILMSDQPDIGAIITFTGKCRSEGGRLSALEIEHYPGMAEKAIRSIVAKVTERWELIGVTIIHRFGLIAAGDDIVLVITAAKHRKEAFEAASFLMDYLKTQAPFWKREHLSDGQVGEWVSAKTSDQGALQQWENIQPFASC
ncbi:molybdenum cofactor biosynthesis protein MoaE [Microvirga sp. W0021]|uniref:Molybdopterin synthase catalytic subunit n=1 Tax=Hohaiivirga grylli TaxID=3133970 RepID=A0ABV0BLP9_9HYPH